MLSLASTVIELIPDGSPDSRVAPVVAVAFSSSNEFAEVQQALFGAMKTLPAVSAAMAPAVYQ